MVTAGQVIQEYIHGYWDEFVTPENAERMERRGFCDSDGALYRPMSKGLATVIIQGGPRDEGHF